MAKMVMGALEGQLESLLVPEVGDVQEDLERADEREPHREDVSLLRDEGKKEAPDGERRERVDRLALPEKRVQELEVLAEQAAQDRSSDDFQDDPSVPSEPDRGGAAPDPDPIPPFLEPLPLVPE